MTICSHIEYAHKLNTMMQRTEHNNSAKEHISPPMMTKLVSTNTENEISGLGPFDVLCGRDKKSYNNIGNRRFRIMININLQKYMDCKTRTERSRMIQDLTNELRQFCGQFRFLKRTKGTHENESDTFIQLNQQQSREKIAHALRDAASQYRIMERKRSIARKLKMMKSEMPSSPKVDLQESIKTIGPNQKTGIDDLLRSTSLIIFRNETADLDELSQIPFSEIFD